ncbi:MAG: hypothetical protein K2M76_05090, partial [Muribaculaceae bacterium]|nr:hypothetical protein [Muribaculaceae bacterium]
MKSYARVMLVAALASGMWACQDDVNAPDPDTFDHVASIRANTSILEVKTIFWTDETNSVERVTPYNADMKTTLEEAGITPMDKQLGDHLIISGRVVSSDYTGNIFKTLIIQDATAAITVSLDATSLWSRYAMGQEVVIDLNDVWIGRYNGLMQIGMEDNGGINRMPLQFFTQHAQLNGPAYISQPDGSKVMNPVDTAIVTLGEVNSYASDPAMFREWSSRLVRFNNVYFEGGGALTYANLEETAKRYILDDNGNTLMVYNSGYSNFWSKTMPAGHGD